MAFHLQKLLRKNKIVLLTIVLLLIPTTVLAGPLKTITESDIVKSQPTNPYSSMNELLTIMYVGLGFHTTVGFIVATVTISKSGINPRNRILGFVALGTALISTYLLTKVKPLAESIISFF